MSKQINKNLGEFDLIEWIDQAAGTGSHLSLGIGDDCAVQPQVAGQDLLTSSDLLIEGIHFKREWTSFFDLGRKSAAVNISDIAAMGGTPQSLFLGLGRPKDISDSDIKDFIAGFISEAELHGAVLAGGDSCGSPGPLLISVTVQGCVASGEAIYRNGASYGDAIYVSGTLGDSAMALQALLKGELPAAHFASRFHTPEPRVRLADKLTRGGWATAMLDVSDGLLADLGHILEDSDVGADIELARVPLSKAFQQELKRDSKLIELALGGGEDYELIFTSPLKDLDRHQDFYPHITRIGVISQTPGLRVFEPSGELFPYQLKGFDHFG